MARQPKKVGGDPTLTLILLGGVAVIGVIMVVVWMKWKKPIMEGKEGGEYLVARPTGEVGPIDVSEPINTNVPHYRAYQVWQRAKRLARDDLEGALRMVEDTLSYAPEYAGDVYFTCVQCIDFYLEKRLYDKRHLPKDQMPMTKSEAKRYFDRELVYYDKALQAYAAPGAKTTLGMSRKPDEMIRRVEEKLKDKREKIFPWWLEHLPD